MYLPWNGAITFGSSERWKDKRHKTTNTCFALTLTKLGFYSRKGTWGFSLSIAFTAFSSLISCKLHIPHKLFISNTNSHSTVGPPVVWPIMRGTWVFGLFLTWYFDICQFFLWYCGIGYPKMPPQVKPCQARLETGWVTCRRYPGVFQLLGFLKKHEHSAWVHVQVQLGGVWTWNSGPRAGKGPS